MVWTTWKGVPIAQLAGDCEPNRCFRMFQNAIQKAREMGKLEMNFDFDTSTAVLDCEQANTKRTKLSALMYWVKKLHESPPEPLKCDYMSECQKCTFIPIYTSSTYALPLSANQFRIICENVLSLLCGFGACSWPFAKRDADADAGALGGRLFVMRGYGHLCQHSHNSGELFIHQHFGISVFRLFAKWPTSFGAKTIPLPLPLGFHKCYVSVVIALYCGWILCKYQHVLCHKCLDFPGNTNYTESELYFELLVGEIDMIKWFLCFKLCSKFVQLLNYLVNPLVFVWFISFIFEIEFKSGYTYQI